MCASNAVWNVDPFNDDIWRPAVIHNIHHEPSSNSSDFHQKQTAKDAPINQGKVDTHFNLGLNVLVLVI